MYHSARSRITLLISLVVVLSTSFTFITAPHVEAQTTKPHISLSPQFGPPTSVIKVNGKDFGGNETVVIQFDSSQVGTVMADSTGAFATKITVPGSAQPGKHVVRAVGQSSG